MTNPLKILFICTGNTCRSPMAEALLRHYAGESVEVRSAGIFALDGSPATPETVTVLQEKGITLEHQAKSVNEELLLWADLILTMTTSHKDTLKRQFPSFSDKIFTLKEYTASSGQEKASSLNIEDPFGGDLEVYRKTVEEIEAEIKKMIPQKEKKEG